MNTPSYSLKSGFFYQSEIIGRKYHSVALFLKILWKNLRSAHLYAWRCCRNVVRNCRWRYSIIEGRSSQPVLVSARRSPITYGLRLPTLTLPISVYFKTISPPIHLLKAVVWDEHQPSSYSSSAFCHWLLSSVLFLGFTYRKALEHYRILDYVTRVIILLFKWKIVKNRFSRFQHKAAQGISRLRFQLCITFVPDYRFTWKKTKC